VDRGVAVALATVVGGMLALQGPINSHLGKTIGVLLLAVGTLLVVRG
jgi:uncharacterized membrane protein YdcZ (DUF606 family)